MATWSFPQRRRLDVSDSGGWSCGSRKSHGTRRAVTDRPAAARSSDLQNRASNRQPGGALTVLLHDGQPIGQIRIMMDGKFALIPAPAGDYTVAAQALGFQPQQFPITIQPGVFTVQDFLLLPR
jgi:hypothetical protein